jgi:hypothetical protein
MTEQLERELTTMFQDRAGRLDVLPPLPVAHVRRARLQSGLAAAAVLALVAGATVVGVRLGAAAPSNGRLSVSSAMDAKQALLRAARQTLAGRWRVDVRMSGPATVGAPSMVIEFDGPAHTAIARLGTRTTAIQVGGKTYISMDVMSASLRGLPAKTKWMVLPAEGVGFGGSGSGSVGFGIGVSDIPLGATELSGVAVTRIPGGFRVDGRYSSRHVVTDIKVAGGYLASFHAVLTSLVPGDRSAPEVDDARLTPLADSLHLSAPDPRTVITEAQFQAATEAMVKVPPAANSRTQCSPSKPSASSSPDGSSGIITCVVRVAPRTVAPGGAGSASPH